MAVPSSQPNCFDASLSFIDEFEAPLCSWSLDESKPFPDLREMAFFAARFVNTTRVTFWLTKHHGQEQACVYDHVAKRLYSQLHWLWRAEIAFGKNPLEAERYKSYLETARSVLLTRFLEFHGVMGAICETFGWDFSKPPSNNVSLLGNKKSSLSVSTCNDYELLIAELSLPAPISTQGRALAIRVNEQLVREFNLTDKSSLRRGHIERAIRCIVRSCVAKVDESIRVSHDIAANTLEILKSRIFEELTIPHKNGRAVQGTQVHSKKSKENWLIGSSIVGGIGSDETYIAFSIGEFLKADEKFHFSDTHEHLIQCLTTIPISDHAIAIELGNLGDDLESWIRTSGEIRERWCYDNFEIELPDNFRIRVYGDQSECALEYDKLIKRLQRLHKRLEEIILISEPSLKPPKISGSASVMVSETSEDDRAEKGVTPHDIAAFLIDNEDDLKVWMVRFNSAKLICKKSSIGQCPLDKRRNLYRLPEILKIIAEWEGLSRNRKSSLEKELQRKLRFPR